MLCYFFPEPAYLFFSADLPGILYYSHIPAVIIALLVGLFVLWSDRKSLLNQLLFGIAVFFSLWTLANLISWTNIHSDFILFVWSFFGVLSGLLSIFSIYFIYVFLNKRDITFTIKLIFLALLVPIIVLAPTSFNLSGFDIAACDAFAYENVTFYSYYSLLGVLAMVWILALLAHAYRRATRDFRKQIVLMGIGIELFLFSFFTIIFLGSYLVKIGIIPDSGLEMYAFFGMIVFMVFIGTIIVRFKAFHASLIAPQALVIALIVLIGSQFTFVRDTTNLVLNGVALVLTGTIGIIIIRSVKREIKLREHVERLAHELEKSNQQQIILIHFITHQLKGFMAKARNIFAMIKEGDYGTAPPEMQGVLDEGLRSSTKGAETIDEILNAANIKSGRVTYERAPVDLKALVEGIVSDLRANADAKGLQLSFTADGTDFTVPGDRLQLTNAFKNLIDNAVKYTQQGSVTVTLVRTGDCIRLTVQDTGVGITPEDMQVLFTEGGHGKESRKINVESTGFGLYIVKNIIEAHRGKVWAESDGAGKGSRFIVEVPVG